MLIECMVKFHVTVKCVTTPCVKRLMIKMIIHGDVGEGNMHSAPPVVNGMGLVLIPSFMIRVNKILTREGEQKFIENKGLHSILAYV